MLTIIMAGGKGTRIASVANDIPKPLISICGKPVLEREIECLRKQGFKDIILTVSHKGEAIMQYFGDGRKLGVSIRYYFENEPLGNAGALFRLMKEIKESSEDSFLLLNADSMFDIDFNRFIAAHKKKNSDVTLFTHPNSHPYDSGLIIADEEGRVKKWLTKEDERPQWYPNRVNAGLHVLRVSVLEEYMASLSEDEKMIAFDAGIQKNRAEEVPIGKVDLDRMILKPLSGLGRMYVYNSPEYVKDMGTPDRYYSVCKDYEEGIVEGKNLSVKQKAIFLDRDGTVNKYVGFLRNVDEFELIPGVIEAVKKINQSGYLAIVISNQPVIARGEVTLEELNEIHNKMETLLGEGGAYLDDIYFCPHHPHKGFDGEIPELKVECECRKPKPGMLLKAAKDYNIDLTQSWMIGDDDNDVLAGANAGCKTGKVLSWNGKEQLSDKTKANVCGESLKDIIDLILE